MRAGWYGSCGVRAFGFGCCEVCFGWLEIETLAVTFLTKFIASGGCREAVCWMDVLGTRQMVAGFGWRPGRWLPLGDHREVSDQPVIFTL